MDMFYESILAVIKSNFCRKNNVGKNNFWRELLLKCVFCPVRLSFEFFDNTSI